MAEILHGSGFLGTSANFAADMTLAVMLVAAMLFTVGLVVARLRRYETHRWIQTAAAIINGIMVLWMMLLPFRDFVIRDVGGPRPSTFYVITTLHATVGLCAFVFGWFVVLRGNNLMIEPLRFKKYRPFMRAAYVLYMLATLLGVWVYFTWFVTIPSPPVY